MKETQINTSLFCIRCKEETDHTITYLNKHISRIHCDFCGRQMDIHIDISHEIYDEVVKRIRSKPVRMSEEYRHHLKEFLLSLPVRIVSKPYRVYREAKEIEGYFKKYSVRKK
ncbi:bh protein [Paenibacillus validus]|uniref:Bh protein n=2 Tax=Paenibacillus validus TaxID=44253 RepID=A0A7X2ZCK6_9BACL|nr:bh protein [Paenibacillus validus]